MTYSRGILYLILALISGVIALFISPLHWVWVWILLCFGFFVMGVSRIDRKDR
jgi:ABC-type multidrug transport system permease subunit